MPTTPTPVDTAYRVAGGQVGCKCTGDVISLNGAWPDDGWSVKSSTSDGGSRLRVEFESGSQRTRVEATCSGGRPVVSVEDDSGGGGGGGGRRRRRRGQRERRRGRRLSPRSRPVRWPDDGGPAPDCREEPPCATC